MSRVSEIYKSYRKALEDSQEQYENLYRDRAEAARKFYREWFRELITCYKDLWSNQVQVERIRRNIEAFFQRSEIDFCAIDGSCAKDPFTDFMVFFGASYGVKGRLSLSGFPIRLRYERWSMDQDVSMVAYVPIPLAKIDDILPQTPESQFYVSDEDKINLANIHTKIMQLAEVYLAYSVASSSAIEYPRLILMDNLLSGIFSSAERGTETGLIGYQLGQRRLNVRDVFVALSRPYSKELEIPSTKHFSLRRRLIAELIWQKGKSLELMDFSRKHNIHPGEVIRGAQALAGIGPAAVNPPIASFVSGRYLVLLDDFDPELSWYDTKRLFEDICTRLFQKKDQGALIYSVKDDGGAIIRRWMSPNDLDFLIAVGMRALIELCWEKRIFLVGIAKDSSTRFLSRHYLGVLRHLGVYPKVDVGPLPWTDRVFLETLAQTETEIKVPWSTVEFDSVFMTLHLEENPRTGEPAVCGMRGWVVLPPERLFLRSLAQFYLRREKSSPLMGHVIFIDRLAHPCFDKGTFGALEISEKELGRIKPMIYLNREANNPAQAIMMYILNVLTRNLYPEVIGYPDPLHKADWGAKSLQRRAKNLIQSSEMAFRVRPINRLFRTLRDEISR